MYYVILTPPAHEERIADCYWTGNRIFRGGVMYAELAVKEFAKSFRTERMAQRSADSLNRRSAQSGTFSVIDNLQTPGPGG